MANSLTGLPIHRDLATHPLSGPTWALWVDIDGLIWLNDQFGHEQGDVAITRVADALRLLLGPPANLFRVAGDEFLALLDGEDREGALTLAQAAVSSVDSLEIPYRRLDRPDPKHLRINVAVLRVSQELLRESIGRHGLGDPIHESAANAVYAEKIRRGVHAGVVVTVPEA